LAPLVSSPRAPISTLSPEILRHGAYTDIDAFWSDIVDAYASELEEIAAAGGSYV